MANLVAICTYMHRPTRKMPWTENWRHTDQVSTPTGAVLRPRPLPVVAHYTSTRPRGSAVCSIGQQYVVIVTSRQQPMTSQWQHTAAQCCTANISLQVRSVMIRLRSAGIFGDGFILNASSSEFQGEKNCENWSPHGKV